MWRVSFLQNFRHRPLHFFGSIAVAMIAIGFLLAFLLVLLPLPISVTAVFNTAPLRLMVGGLIAVLLGLLAEWNVHESLGNTKLMPIAETIDVNGNKPALSWNDFGSVFDDLSANAALSSASGATTATSPSASPYINAPLSSPLAPATAPPFNSPGSTRFNRPPHRPYLTPKPRC